MSVARFIADQRTFYRVPHAFTCLPGPGGEPVVVLQVARPATDGPSGASGAAG